jgi:single-strand DNA-binding protein
MATRSWNRVELIGNLTRDPELRYTPTGTAVATFSIATNRTYVSEGERKEEADFHRIVAWNKLAELCSQLLKKGTRVFVSGRLQNRTWEGQDGQQRNTTEIVIEDMIILTNKSFGEESPAEFNEDVSSRPAPRASVPTPAPVVKEPVEDIEPGTPASLKEAPKNAPKEEATEDVGDLDDKDLPF